jgi:hypothetical protein
VFRLIKHFVRQKAKIEQVKDQREKSQRNGNASFRFFAAETEVMQNRKNDQQQANDPKVDDVVMEEIRQVYRFGALASWERHDEVQPKDLDADEENNPGDELNRSCHGVSDLLY